MKKYFLSFIALFLAVSAHALEIPEKPTAYVNDYAGLLSPAAKAELEKTLYDFEQKTSNQIVVAVFNSLDGGSLEDFSIHLAEKWKIGQKGKDNGVILLVFKEDRAVRIEVGYGLEGALPDALADQIIRREFVPAFKEGRYDAGVEQAVQAIMQATQGEYKAENKSLDPLEKKAPLLFFILVTYLLAPVIAYILVFIFCIGLFGMSTGFLMSLPVIFILVILRKILLGSFFGQTLNSRSYRGGFGGWGSGGSGGFSGGGFSGGGGGSFGGGGASGRW